MNSILAEYIYFSDRNIITFAEEKNLNLETVIFLIENSNNLDVQDNEGYTSLMTAFIKGVKLELIKLLIAKSNNVDLQSGEKRTALSYAIDYNKYIVNNQNNNSLKQLQKISESKHENILKSIIEKSNNLDIQNEYGYTPLMSILEMRYSDELIKLTIEKSKNLDLQNCFSNTVLMKAIVNTHISDEIIDLLVEKSNDLDIQDFNGYIALKYALEDEYISADIIHKIIEKTTNFDVKDEYYKDYTLLMIAIKCNQSGDIVSQIAKKCHPDIQNRKGITNLMYMLKHEIYDYDIIINMIDRSDNLDIQDENGETALMYAIGKHYDCCIIEKLIKNSNLDIVNNNNYSALLVAINYENKIALNLLNKYIGISVEDKQEIYNELTTYPYHNCNAHFVDYLIDNNFLNEITPTLLDIYYESKYATFFSFDLPNGGIVGIPKCLIDKYIICVQECIICYNNINCIKCNFGHYTCLKCINNLNFRCHACQRCL